MDDELCDFPFSIRITKSLAEEINRRAAAEGMKASAWARKALEYSLYHMHSDERKISSAGLIDLIKYDSDVKTALWDMFNEFLNSDLGIYDKNGNPVDLEDTGISPIKRLAMWMHHDSESVTYHDSINPIRLEHRENTDTDDSGNASGRKRNRRKSN